MSTPLPPHLKEKKILNSTTIQSYSICKQVEATCCIFGHNYDQGNEMWTTFALLK